jgi:hypothetical protein
VPLTVAAGPTRSHRAAHPLPTNPEPIAHAELKLGVGVEELAATGAQRIGDGPLCVFVLTDLDPDDVPGRSQVPGVMLDMNRYTAGAASA